MDSSVFSTNLSFEAWSLLQRLLAYLNFTLDSIFLLVQTERVNSVNYGNSTSSWKPWRLVKIDEGYIHQFQPEPTHKIHNFKGIFPWNISQTIINNISTNTRIVGSYAIKRSILFWICWRANGNWDSNMIRISQCRESHCRTNTSVRRRNK